MFKFGAKTKKEEKKIRKELKIGREIFETISYKRYDLLMKVVEKYSAKEVIKVATNIIKARSDSIKFSLIDCFEKFPEHELGFSETDPLLTLDSYIRSIRKWLLVIEEVANKRRKEILKMRRKYKRKVKK